MLLGGIKRVLSGQNFHKAEDAQPSGTSSGTNTPVQAPKRHHTCEEGTAASSSSSHALDLHSPTAAATSRFSDGVGGGRPSGLPPVPTASTTPAANYSSLAASGAAAYAVMLQGFSRGVVPSFSPGGLLGTAGSGVTLPPVKQQQQDADAAEAPPKLSLGMTRSQSVPALDNLGGSGAVATSTGNSSHPQVMLSHQNFWLA